MSNDLIEALEASNRWLKDLQKRPGLRVALQPDIDANEAILKRHRSQQEAAQEPLGYISELVIERMRNCPDNGHGEVRATICRTPDVVASAAIYTASPARQEPLTIETIGRLVSASEVHEYHTGAIVEFVRSVESMHGITDAALSDSGQKDAT